MALVLLASIGRAEVRSPSALSGFYETPPLEESLADEFGQAVIAELARLMLQRADAACLKSRKLSDAALRKAAGDILLRYGRKVLAWRFPDIDPAAVEAEFVRIAGPQALDDMRKFATSVALQKYRSLLRMVSRDGVVDFIAHDFDSYLLHAQLTLGQELFRVGSGNRELSELVERRERLLVEEQQKAFANDAAQQVLEKYLNAVYDALGKVVNAIHKGVDPAYTAYIAFAGVETDLRNACVRLDK